MNLLFLIAALASTPSNIGATPQQAVLNSFALRAPRTVRIVRVNVVGDYATVLTTGAALAGDPLDSPILLERFSFGWQMLDDLNFACNLRDRGLPTATTDALMRGMPQPEAERTCTERARDLGPKADVAVIRQLKTREPFVPTVRVVGKFGIVQWYGAGGGEAIVRRRYGTWLVVKDGGGAWSAAELGRFGVPLADRCRLVPEANDCNARPS